MLQQPIEKGADLAVVVEHDAWDALDALAGVAEHAPGSVDHPLLRVGVGEHALGQRAEADEVVSELAGEAGALVRRDLRGLTVERLGSVRGEDLLYDLLGALTAGAACEVDVLGGEHALDA
jgi:hypothetical protein